MKSTTPNPDAPPVEADGHGLDSSRSTSSSEDESSTIPGSTESARSADSDAPNDPYGLLKHLPAPPPRKNELEAKPDFDITQAPSIEKRLRTGFREWLWRNQAAILEEGMMLLKHADKDHGPRVKLFEKLVDKMADNLREQPKTNEFQGMPVMNIQINNLERGRAIDVTPSQNDV